MNPFQPDPREEVHSPPPRTPGGRYIFTPPPPMLPDEEWLTRDIQADLGSILDNEHRLQQWVAYLDETLATEAEQLLQISTSLSRFATFHRGSNVLLTSACKHRMRTTSARIEHIKAHGPPSEGPHPPLPPDVAKELKQGVQKDLNDIKDACRMLVGRMRTMEGLLTEWLLACRVPPPKLPHTDDPQVMGEDPIQARTDDVEDHSANLKNMLTQIDADLTRRATDLIHISAKLGSLNQYHEGCVRKLNKLRNEVRDVKGEISVVAGEIHRDNDSDTAEERRAGRIVELGDELRKQQFLCRWVRQTTAPLKNLCDRLKDAVDAIPVPGLGDWPVYHSPTLNGVTRSSDRSDSD
ncbi:hypothetical protein M011DRAFT_474824 [Sporormia fimetaria CBS 119925]|uniref:Uncharacterized protein n=1 Tax=Sporormia fimetaria CBS 119925 TaxID=1340428 RepID=A0A6A6VIG1_9PLEO|nr:hypothetical protein M011DRAFT_474824 [Sporormia fimetaria CBS 119925]